MKLIDYIFRKITNVFHTLKWLVYKEVANCNMYLVHYLIGKLVIKIHIPARRNRIGVVIVRVLASSVVDRRIKMASQSGHTKDYTINMCCFSSNPASWGVEAKTGLARNQGNMWSNISTCVLLFLWAIIIKI